MPDLTAFDLTIRTNSKKNSETFICLFLHAFVLCVIYTESFKSSNPKNPENLMTSDLSFWKLTGEKILLSLIDLIQILNIRISTFSAW